MRRTLVGFLLIAFATLSQPDTSAQQIPFLSELFSRYEELNRVSRPGGANSAALETFRKRSEEQFKLGSIPGMLEAIGEAQSLLAGKKWDERQKFISSLTIETDRLVVEPNQILQVSLTRMFPTNLEKAFGASPTVTFQIVAGEQSAKSGEAPPPPPLSAPLPIAERLTIAETSNNAARKLLLSDGAYEVVARIEAGGKPVAELKKPIYAISDFSSSIAVMSRNIAGIKSSADPKVKAAAYLLSTPEFQLQRLTPLNKTRGDIDLNPIKEMDRIESELAAITKGRNPFTRERGELERAYRATDGALVPYRLYIPQSYDDTNPKPLVVMLHGELGDERYYFSGVSDASLVKAEADRRGWILAGTNGRGRFGVSDEDVFEVVKAVTADYKIDSARIYLTGHSKGGFGAWLIAARKPDLFAALAAVSAGPPAEASRLGEVLAPLKNTAALLVHGAQDTITPVQLSRTMATAAEKAGLKVALLEIPGGDHLSVVGSSFPAVMEFFEKNPKATKSQ
ncbi:MAG TPA: prolyl oligopeptidase family serine peptidase [Blastocatellia bacterium]|nr:prolyl oligopeptidase family serine peptidase [Blastocatellia bacterium]